MARTAEGRRWFVRSLLVGLIPVSGCSSTRPGSRQADLDKPAPIRDIDTRPDVGAFGRLHEWFAGHRNGPIDPNQIP
jgi:hypothetical protein